MVSPKQLANSYIADLAPYVPGKPGAWLEREYGIQKSIKLCSNENPLGPSPKVVETIQNFKGNLAHYPDGSAFDLVEAISKKVDVEASQITLGNGSEEIIRFAIQTFCGPDDEILVPEHSFIAYELCAKSLNIAVKKAPLNQWQVDTKALLASITGKTKVIFIANPGNPTGTYIDHKTVAEFMSQVPDHCMVVLDEAYAEYMTASDYPDSFQLLRDHANLIVTRTFSKAYGLAGLRIGYSISHDSVANLFNRIRFPFNTNSLAQAAAIVALKDQAHVEASCKVNEQGRALYTEFFAEQGIEVISKAANFVTIQLPFEVKPFCELLLRQGIIARDLYPYGLKQILRISIGTGEQNQACLAALENALTRRD